MHARRHLAALLLLATAATPASAQLAFFAKQANMRAELVVAGNPPVDGRTLVLGVRVKLANGWKTYWRSPGENGLPSEFDFSKSENLRNVTLSWPAPQRLQLKGGGETIGYADEVVFPVRAEIVDPTKPTKVSLHLNLYGCENLCVKEEFNLAAEVAPYTSNIDAQALLVQWQNRVPRETGPVRVTSVQFKDDGKPRLEIEAIADEPFAAPDVFVEGSPEIVATAPVMTKKDDRTTTFTVGIEDASGKDVPLADRQWTVTLVDGDRSIEAKAGKDTKLAVR